MKFQFIHLLEPIILQLVDVPLEVSENEYGIIALAAEEILDLFYLLHLSLMNLFDSAHDKVILINYDE